MSSRARRPRLALVVSHPIQHFAPLYRELAAAGDVDLRVFFCCDWGVRRYHDPAFGREVEWDVPLLDGYAHEFLPIPRRPAAISFREVDNPAVADRLAAFGPDAVLVHGYGCRTMWRASGWAARRGVPVLLSSDSHLGAREARWKRPLKRLIVGRFYGRLSGALGIGSSNRAYHQRFGLPEERIFPGVLPVDGRRLLDAAGDRVDARRELRDRMRIPRDGVLALFCGNLTSWKRPVDFVSAVERCGPPLWGLVVGDGPERAAAEAASPRPEGRVRFAGFVNQSRIPGCYAAADLLVVPSERDAHPLVVTEALFFGLPIVLSAAVGCIGEDDTARPYRNAIVFPVGDLEALARHLGRLSGDEPAMRAMGAESLRIAPEHDARRAADLVADAVRRVLVLGPRVGPGSRTS